MEEASSITVNQHSSTTSHSDMSRTSSASSVLAVIQGGGHQHRHRRRRCHCHCQPSSSKRPKVVSDLNNPNPPPPPRGGGGADLISTLPNSLIQEILSLLPIKDAIKTSVLSQRWKPVWTEMPALCFIQTSLGLHQLSKFADFVNETLAHFTGPKVKNLIICFRFADSMSSTLENWVRFATTHHVEDLSLVFNERIVYPNFTESAYRLPQFFYMYPSFQNLTLRQCDFWPEAHVFWPSLRVLSIYFSRLNKGALECILSGSPNLQNLKLRGCEGIGRIISSTSLQVLEIDGIVGPPYHQDTDSSVTEISCPNLMSLSLLGNMYKKRFKLVHVSSLSEANLGFMMTTEYDDEYDCTHHVYILRELIEKLRHVKNLTVGTWCIEVLSIWKLNGISCPLSTRNCLVLDTEICGWDLPGIVSLLQSSTYLEKLVINLSPRDNFMFEFHPQFFEAYQFEGVEPLTSADWIFKCFLRSLKSIEITGFLPSYSDPNLVVDLMEFLLKKTLALKTVVIYARDDHFSSRGVWNFSDDHAADENTENEKRNDIIRILAKTIPEVQFSCT